MGKRDTATAPDLSYVPQFVWDTGPYGPHQISTSSSYGKSLLKQQGFGGGAGTGDASALPAPKTPTGYDLSPKPTSGNGPFGAVPGQLGLPDPAGDLSKLYPNLSATNSQVSSNVMNELHGELSPDTQAAIQDAAARFGVSSGMPGSGLQNHRTVRDLGLNTEALQHQGLQDYLASITGIKNTQTVSPELQTEIAMQNSLNRAAPDPTAAATYAKQLFDAYLARMRGPGGGTGPVNPGAFSPGAATGTGGGFKLPSAFTAPRPGATQTPSYADYYDPLDPGGEFDYLNQFTAFDPLDPGGEFDFWQKPPLIDVPPIA